MKGILLALFIIGLLTSNNRAFRRMRGAIVLLFIGVIITVILDELGVW